jgi:hypothetical protein
LAAASFKNTGCSDANTLEATQTMLETRSVDGFFARQEILIRHLHVESAAWIDDYQTKTAGV